MDEGRDPDLREIRPPDAVLYEISVFWAVTEHKTA